MWKKRRRGKKKQERMKGIVFAAIVSLLIGVLVTFVTHSASPTTRTKRVFFILGGPGSGKGTQCKRLSKEFGFAHISTGELLRSIATSATNQVGKEVAEIIGRGGLVPNEIVMRVLDSAIEGSDSEGVLVDGFPRNVEQLDEIMRVMPSFEGAIYLKCSEETMKKRIRGRSASASTTTKRERDEQRSDDTEEIATKRLSVFREETMAVVEKLREMGKLTEIDGEGRTEEVFERVRKVFDPKRLVHP